MCAFVRACRDSVVDIATRNGLDGLGIQSWWGRDFPHPSKSALGPTQPPVQWEPRLFPGASNLTSRLKKE